ncbi:MAG: Bathycoccus sp [Bacteroidota bacterium]
MPPHISLNELYNMQRKKENYKKTSYDKILEMCHRRIRNISSFGGQNTFFEVPGLLVGYPLYNIYHCTDYLVDQLRKSGFLIQILPPPQICVLYISWDPNELKPKANAPKALPAPGPSYPNSLPSLPPRIVTKTEPKKEVQFSYI